MKKLKPLLRGWLAISFVQQIGLAIQHLRNPSIIYKTLFDFEKTNETLAGHFFVLLCLQQSLLKGAILIKTNDKFLHIFHIFNSSMYLISFGFKILFPGGKELIFSMGVMAQIFFSSITILLTCLYLLQEPSKNGNDGPEKENDRRRGPRKLISKHFLESHISNYNNDSQIRKNQ